MSISKKQRIEDSIKLLFESWVKEQQLEVSNRSKIRYAGPVLGSEEYSYMLDAIFNDWWSGGKYTNEAEKKLTDISLRDHTLLTNSGSSANLLLMAAAKELYFKDGDEILTLACGFPTTVNPIIQNRLVPHFVDIDLKTLNLDPNLMEDTLKKNPKIKGVFVAHTLGFPSQINEILNIARKYNVQVFFDCCDAYGTLYEGKPIQSFGKAVSYSFYVAHHLTMGEGGGLSTNDEELFITARSMRNWGKYCASPVCCVRSGNPEVFCPTGKLTKHCELPDDYNVNYQFEYLGYNLKPLELQSAILTKQLDKLQEFDNIRKANYNQLFTGLYKYIDYGYTMWELPEGTSPFAFPILLPENRKYQRKHLVDHLKHEGIESRMLFGGNLMKHPAFANKKQYWTSSGTFENSDDIMNNFIMLGVSPVNSDNDTIRVMQVVRNYFNKFL